MSVSINIDPVGVDVKQIPGPPDDDGNPTVGAIMLQFFDPALAIVVGPFSPDGFESFKEYLADPAGEAERARIRERISVVNGGKQPPKMTVPRG